MVPPIIPSKFRRINRCLSISLGRFHSKYELKYITKSGDPLRCRLNSYNSLRFFSSSLTKPKYRNSSNQNFPLFSSELLSDPSDETLPHLEQYIEDHILEHSDGPLRLSQFLQIFKSHRLSQFYPAAIDRVFSPGERRDQFIKSIETSDPLIITNSIFSSFLPLVHFSDVIRESICRILLMSDINPAVLLIQLSRYAEDNQFVFNLIKSTTSTSLSDHHFQSHDLLFHPFLCRISGY